MIVDTSALVAVLRAEPDAARIAHALERAPVVRISAGTLVELWIVAARRLGPAGTVQLARLLECLDPSIESVTLDQAMLAREGFIRFGRGQHPAALNFGDCFAYALARTTGEPLLCTGDDFAMTDLTLA